MYARPITPFIIIETFSLSCHGYRHAVAAEKAKTWSLAASNKRGSGGKQQANLQFHIPHPMCFSL